LAYPVISPYSIKEVRWGIGDDDQNGNDGDEDPDQKL
jgi:hypothetical protein